MMRRLLLLLLLALPALAVPAVVHQTTDTATTLTSWTTVTGNVLVVGVRDSGGAAFPSRAVTDTAGDVFVPIALCQDNSIGVVQWFLAKNITGTVSNVITVTYQGSFPAALAYELSGLSTVGPFDIVAACHSNSGTSHASSSFSTVTADEILLTLIGVNSTGVTFTADTGWTLGTTVSSGDAATQYKIVSSLQSGITTTMTTNSSVASQLSVLTLQVPASGGGSTGGSSVVAQ